MPDVWRSRGSTYVNGKDTPSQVGDEIIGQWSEQQSRGHGGNTDLRYIGDHRRHRDFSFSSRFCWHREILPGGLGSSIGISA
jgi:hypothetical protein